VITRRKFLSTLALAAVAATAPAVALADYLTEPDLNGAPMPDLVPSLLQWRPEVQTQYIEGVLNLKSGHTGERYTFEFRDTRGNYNREILQSLDYFLRCNYDRQWVQMDIKVIEMLNYLSKWYPGNPEITIHSGYRSPYYNELIRHHNENVAKNSLHMAGRAIDFSIRGVPIRDVCSAALAVRNMAGAGGGVGYYPQQGFVHLDSGDRQATWVR